MSLLAATQIPKPADEQAFERASIVLWRGLLGDPNVQRNGRRGQRQNGVDLFGLRNSDPEHHVGIQCKLKGDGHSLTEEEVRGEVAKALAFRPRLKEYFVITTAPDDVAMQELARELTAELNKAGTPLLVYVWGWNTLEERITEDAAARKVFDPTFGPFSEQILAETQRITSGQSEARSEIGAGLSRIEAQLADVATRLQTTPGDTTTTANAVEAHLDAEIDNYREMANDGRPRAALPFLQNLLARVNSSASGRILFRIKANIGSCLLALGEDDKAASMLSEAYDHAPSEPKAIANKAFSLLLRGQWQELLSFGTEALKADPTNEGLAGYLVQAARFDTSIDEPLDLVPEGLRGAAEVAIGRVDFIRRRRSTGDWWEPARQAVAAHPSDPHAIQFAAEADIDEIVTSESFQHTRRLTPDERARLHSAAATLIVIWNKARSSDGVLRPEDAAMCSNIIVTLHALDDLPRALEIARQGLELAPDDVSILTRAAMIAIDSQDDVLAAELLPKLPDGPEAAVLAFRLYSEQKNWSELANLYSAKAEHIPEVERLVVAAASRLAAIRTGEPDARHDALESLARDVAADARASILVADFARIDGFDDIAEAAFHTALRLIDDNAHFASRMMVALHAGRRGDWSVVADLLDGHIAEDHDSEELRTLARAFVNDSPIRQRALSFFARLAPPIRDLPFFLHAEGLLHFNHGDLPAAETILRKAVEAQPELDNYLALISVLRRSQRGDEVKPILDGIDLATARGTTIQKMHVAQLLRAAGEGPKALAYAYDVLQAARNDPEAALGYFGLIMMNPDDGLIPTVHTVGTDTFVRLEGEHGQNNSFLITENDDRPAEGILSLAHPTAVAAKGLKVGDTFDMPAGFGNNRTWRIAEIKHKFLHALHDVMENFEKRFPDAKGFYTVTMEDGDVQPALDQVRRASENNRKLADLYLVQNVPLNMVADHLGGDTIGFVEYIRSLDADIRTCVGMEVERLAARALIVQHRAAGAVLDTYTAWTVATMGAFDVLKAIFGTLVVPQSVIDELRILRDKQEWTGEPSMTIAWHNGQYIRQEHTPEDVAARHSFIAEQLAKIEAACGVRPATAPDTPSEAASLITGMFGTHVLDAANLATDGYLLVSEDMNFRQWAEMASSVKGVWLQPVFAFAQETEEISDDRYASLLVKLAWRRHGHIAIDPQALLDAFQADTATDLPDFQALANFIGTGNAEMKSHLDVLMTFLNHIWKHRPAFDVKTLKATGILLEKLIRHTGETWALTVAFIKRGADNALRQYIDNWVRGHFLSAHDLAHAEVEISEITRGVRARRAGQFGSSAVARKTGKDRRSRRRE
ncbi:tetratricopeptide repeat protein [Mesorhizobium sp. M0037]|uniref:tetratricopeptide repeat protein n=1 Tax=unclassified Mesorhizobium TaxID=325217 RepID=UPI00333BD64F